MSRKKKRLNVSIDRLEPKGTSGLDDESKRWLIRGAPLHATVEALSGRKGRAQLQQVVTAAPDQIDPECPVFGVCGGCALQRSPLDTQRAAKQDMVERLVDFPSQPIVGASQGYGYRNKLEVSFSERAFKAKADDPDLPDGSWMGFHPPGWFSKVVPITGCPLGSPTMNVVIEAVAGMKLGPCWNNHTHQGHYRHLTLRQGDQLLVTFGTTSAVDKAQLQQAAETVFAIEGVGGVLHVINDGVADVAQGELQPVLFGEDTLRFTLGDKVLTLPHDAFFQVNTPGAQLLYDTIGGMIGSGGTLLDLYCGNGVIGIMLGHRFDRVVGIELHPGAIACAQTNAEANGVAGNWIAGKVEDLLPNLEVSAAHVIVDPPRAGLHPKAAQTLAQLQAETLTYVACSPASLARDRPVLEDGGWRMSTLACIDLFPQTPHVEAVARFVR